MDAQGARGILSYFARHRTLANLVLAVMLIAGLAAAMRLRAQYFPDVVVSEVSVTVRWDGAGPEDVDRAIVSVLEPSLLTIDGVADVTSRATEGRAVIGLEFEPGLDLARATEDVKAVVDAVTTLPDDVDSPQVRQDAWRDQVTDVVISGPVAVEQLARFADELVTRLFAEGVTRTTIRGIADPRIVIEVPTVNLIRHDLTMADIAAAVAAETGSAPAGEVASGAARVRMGEERRTVEDIGAVVLRSGSEGTSLTVADVAEVRAEPVNRGRATYVGENPAVTMRVDRSDGGDAIRIQAAVEAVVAEMQPNLPPGVQVDLIRARADQISQRLTLVVDNAVQGLAIVLVLLFLFLNARLAFWVASGIPAAILATLAVMYVTGMTLNMISLFALILTLGVIVDDAIVVSEHAEYRHRVLGEPPVIAAERAAQGMALPVMASMITMVIAFAALVIIGGRFGELIRDIPLTVIAVLVTSFVECFLVLPNHIAHALAHSPRQAWYDAPSRLVNRGFGWFVARVMRPLTALVLRARYAVVAGVVFLLVSQVSLLIRGDVQFRFFDAPEQSSITGNFSMLPGAESSDALAMMREVQRAVDATAASFEAEHGRNPVTYVLAEVGGTTGRGLAGAEAKEPDLLGGISIELIDPDFRPYSSFAFVSALQEEVRNHPLLEELSFRGGRFGPGGDALSVDLSGAEAETLKSAAEALKTALSAYPEVSALEDTLAYDKEEMILTLTPQGQSLGFQIGDLGRALRDRLNGIEAATFPQGTRTASIRVELPEDELTADFLDRTLMRAGPGIYVPLSDIVAVETRAGFSTIRRENGLRIVTVSGDVQGDDPVRANAVQADLREVILPQIAADFGVGVRSSGQAEQERAFLGDAWLGFLMALVGIYLTLAWAFASWARPLVVMSVIPFALTGAVWGHYVWGVPMSMFSIVGLIGMVGIVVNDSIVLVSTVDEYAERRGLIPAVIDAVGDRLRPIFMTTSITVLGLVPMLFERSSQALFLKPTVITLVYGLGLGMFLVLFLVPAILGIQADWQRQRRAFRRAIRGGHAGMARMRRVVALAALTVALAFGGTLGAVLAFGALPAPVLAALPALAGLPAGPAALGLFLVATLVIVAVALLTGRLALRRYTASSSSATP
ncbi:MAG: efflux RND transporter permease subunit [Gemmobacter sp.]